MDSKKIVYAALAALIAIALIVLLIKIVSRQNREPPSDTVHVSDGGSLFILRFTAACSRRPAP